MAEIGLDITGERPKLLEVDAVQASDVVTTMGCGDICLPSGFFTTLSRTPGPPLSSLW